MVAPRELDPSASVLAFFGSELRRLRLAAGLSQERLGEIVNYTGALVGLIETASRTPSRDFAERCDGALGAEGGLVRLWPLVSSHRFPSWFRGYVEMEATASAIRTFQVQAVHGLLQTEDYARALMDAARTEDASVDEKVTARMDRQSILARPQPPRLWMIADEAVLRRSVGGREVHRTQLNRLLDSHRPPQVTIQVLPFSAGAHAGSDGSFNLLSFAESGDVAYFEGYGSGNVIMPMEEVDRFALRYDLLRAAALSPGDSAELIAKIMEEL